MSFNKTINLVLLWVLSAPFSMAFEDNSINNAYQTRSKVCIHKINNLQKKASNQTLQQAFQACHSFLKNHHPDFLKDILKEDNNILETFKAIPKNHLEILLKHDFIQSTVNSNSNSAFNTINQENKFDDYFIGQVAIYSPIYIISIIAFIIYREIYPLREPIILNINPEIVPFAMPPFPELPRNDARRAG